MSKARIKYFLSLLITFVICLSLLEFLKDEKNQEIIVYQNNVSLNLIDHDYMESNNFPEEIDPICKNFTYEKSKRKIDPRNLSYVINPISLCTKKSPLLFIYVFSKVDSFEIREIIRKTWGNTELFPGLKLAFILGLSKENLTNIKVKSESESTGGDIIQGNFQVLFWSLNKNIFF